MVRCINTEGKFGNPTEDGYYQKLVTAFNHLLPKVCPSSPPPPPPERHDYIISPNLDLSPPQPFPPSARACVRLDGANGVGAGKVMRLMKQFGRELGDEPAPLTVEVSNDGSSGILNHKVTTITSAQHRCPALPAQCGADYVKIGHRAPEGMEYSEGDRCVSFDGDADRIVYFYKDKCESHTHTHTLTHACTWESVAAWHGSDCLGGQFKLVDGDKIAALVRQ